MRRIKEVAGKYGQDQNTLVRRASASKHREGTARSMFVSRDWHVLSRTAPYYYVWYAVHSFRRTVADCEFQELVPVAPNVHVNTRRHLVEWYVLWHIGINGMM